MDGKLVSHSTPQGRIAFSASLAESGRSLGAAYANELGRHFAGLEVTDEPFVDVADLRDRHGEVPLGFTQR
jgi:hypothetical protein